MVTSGFVEFEAVAYGELAKPPPLIAVVLRASLRRRRPLTSTFSNGRLAFLGRFSRPPIKVARHCIGQVARGWRAAEQQVCLGRPERTVRLRRAAYACHKQRPTQWLIATTGTMPAVIKSKQGAVAMRLPCV
jgi:hypothetical protein